jgi:hypothetical protein
MALQSTGAISFADINTEMNNSMTTQLDAQTAGEGFQLDVNATNWSDSTAGLSLSEFYGLDYDAINYSGGGGAGGGTS